MSCVVNSYIGRSPLESAPVTGGVTRFYALDMATVRSPPRSIADTRTTNNDVHLQCGQCKVVVSEMLTFIANKVDTLPETGIVQICLSAYNYDEIENARTIAFNLLAPTKKYMRRKEGTEQKSIQEIIKLVKECEPDNLPLFVAKNLNKVPPVTFDYIDVTTFLKELTILKNDVATIRNKSSTDTATSTYLDVKKELDEMKNMIRKLREDRPTSSKRNEDLFLRPYHEDKDKRNKSNIQCTDYSAVSAIEPHKEVGARATGDVNKQAAAGARDRVQLRTIASSISQIERLSTPPSSDRAPLLSGPADNNTYTPTYRDILGTHGNDTRCDDGFTTVTRKKPGTYRYRNVRGTLQSSGRLQAAESYAYVYLSRTQKHVTIENIKEHIEELNERCLDVIQLQQNRDTNFNSFKIQVLASKLNVFLNKDFWPEGLVFRRFRQQRYVQNDTVEPKSS